MQCLAKFGGKYKVSWQYGSKLKENKIIIFIEPNEEKQTETKPKPIQNIQQVPAEPKMTASQSTKSLLRQYILKESNDNLIENKDKNEPNTFMGQNICSPTAFASMFFWYTFLYILLDMQQFY